MQRFHVVLSGGYFSEVHPYCLYPYYLHSSSRMTSLKWNEVLPQEIPLFIWENYCLTLGWISDIIVLSLLVFLFDKLTPITEREGPFFITDISMNAERLLSTY